MIIEFETKRIEKKYSSSNIQKEYGKAFKEKLEMMMGFIIDSENAYDVKCVPQYHMHILKGNYNGVYSLSPDNKKTKWRVLTKCIDSNNQFVKPKEDEKSFLKTINKFRMGDIVDYHE